MKELIVKPSFLSKITVNSEYLEKLDENFEIRFWFGDEEIKIDCYSKFPSDQLVDFELKEVEE